MHTWHDPKNRRLAKAVRKLARLDNANDPDTQTTRTLWTLTFLVGVASLSVIGLTTHTISTGTSVIVGSCCIMAMVCRMQFWPYIAKWRLRRHLQRLRAGKYGHAFMIDCDSEWNIMDTALRAHGMVLSQVLNREQARQHLARYLDSTHEARLALRKPRLETGVADPLIEHIQRHAKTAAEWIGSTPLRITKNEG